MTPPDTTTNAPGPELVTRPAAPTPVSTPQIPDTTPVRTAGAGGEERVGTILADRLCTKCFYNLSGQPVVRARPYDLLVARCPECGTVASLQEYPHLSRWSRRAIVIVALAWFGFLLLSLVASAAYVRQKVDTLTSVAAEPGAMKLAEAHKAWQEQRAALQYPPQPNSYNNWWAQQAPTIYSQIEPVFFDEHPAIAYFDQAGSWGAIWTRRLLVEWGLGIVGCVIMGMFWSVVLPHARRWRRLLVVPVIVGIAAAMALMNSTGTAYAWGGWNYALYSLQPLIRTPVAFVGIASYAAPIAMGVYLGRPFARWAVRALVPPRLREPLLFLWLNDGLPAPALNRS